MTSESIARWFLHMPNTIAALLLSAIVSGALWINSEIGKLRSEMSVMDERTTRIEAQVDDLHRAMLGTTASREH